MKAKISHVKSMDDLHLHVHSVIANTKPTFQSTNHHLDVTNTFFYNHLKNREIISKVVHTPPKVLHVRMLMTHKEESK